MSVLKTGARIALEGNSGSIQIIKKLGEGGQGYVYLVDYNGQQLALKWYKKGALTNPENFRQNLANNIKEKAPTANFLWPLALTEMQDGTFGYVMLVRPQGYYELSDFLTGRHEFVSVDAMLKAAIQIVDSFRILHNRGFSYQDLNDGNFFMNPQTGDVLICDNDNVSQFGANSGIAGKCRYMAPAVVVGRKVPDARTDQFSLAVVLFLLLLRNHPLEGSMTQKSSIMTEQHQKYYYGEHPVFIADPEDACNRPVNGVHNNMIRRWPQMPVYVQEAFQKAFSKGVMYQDKMGVTEKEWLQHLLRFRAEVIQCPHCGKETRYDSEGKACVCCRQPIRSYGWLQTKYYKIPIFENQEIVEAYITDCYDHNESSHLIAVVALNKDKSKAALRNKEQTPWDIGNAQIPPEKLCAIPRGAKLTIKNEQIEIV